jgi:thiamine-phosphate pyrophosphorylase
MNQLADGARLIAHRSQIGRETKRRRQNAIVYAMLGLRGFYAILDLTPALAQEEQRTFELARQLLAAGPCCLQLRAKAAGAHALAASARRLLPLCRAAGVPFCVNDRLDVALAVGSEVAHLGQDDLPLADALRVRAQAGRPDLALGISTHNRRQAVAAVEAGANYIGFGPIFGTGSKANPDPTVGLDALAEVCRTVSVPVVAIGGITLDVVGLVAQAGAAAAAVIAAVATAPDPTAAGRLIGLAFGSLA